ncbi:MAG: hypothetical protein HC904_02600 [Blastochloris sp.]|nr:hypothetical protein [Blastochloris sp.]
MRESLCLGLGTVIGLFLVLAIYEYFGVREDFINAVAPHSGGSYFSTNRIRGFFGERSFMAFTAVGAVLLTYFLFKSRKSLRRTFLKPLSFVVEPSKTLSIENLNLLFICTLFLGIPTGLAILGKFSAPYTWMALMPSAIGLGYLASTWTIPKPIKYFTCGLLTLGIAIGYPLRGVTAAYHWHDATQIRTSDFVNHVVDPEDHVVYITQVFYPVKLLAKQAYYAERYLPLLRDSEKTDISLLLLPEDRVDDVIKIIGGSWSSIGDELVVFHRRFPLPTTEIRIRAWQRDPEITNKTQVMPGTLHPALPSKDN